MIYQGSAYIGVASRGDSPVVQGRLLRVSLETHEVQATFDVVPPDTLGGGIVAGSRPRDQYRVRDDRQRRRARRGAVEHCIHRGAGRGDVTPMSAWRIPRGEQDSDPGWSTPILFDAPDGTPLVSASGKNGIVYTLDRRDLAAGPLWQTPIATGGSCPQCGDGAISGRTYANGALFRAGGEFEGSTTNRLRAPSARSHR